MVYTSPNLSELDAMLRTLPGGSQHLPKITPTSEDSLVLHVANEAVKLITHYGISVLLVTMSEAGVLIVRQGLPDAPLPLAGRVDPLLDSPVSAVWYKGQPCSPNSLVSVSGAGGVSTLVDGWNERSFTFLHQTGDCLAAGFIAAALKGLKQEAAVAAGLQAAISCSTNNNRFSFLNLCQHFFPLGCKALVHSVCCRARNAGSVVGEKCDGDQTDLTSSSNLHLGFGNPLSLWLIIHIVVGRSNMCWNKEGDLDLLVYCHDIPTNVQLCVIVAIM